VCGTVSSIQETVPYTRAPAGDAVAALGGRLERLPQFVSARQTIPLGTYHGLRFGIILHPQWQPEIFLEG
jgi:hypothetical protein